MSANDNSINAPVWRGMCWVGWGGAAVLLSLPLIARRFTGEVNWTGSDFLVMGAVSYTHLDVYKRQGKYAVRGRIAYKNTLSISQRIKIR